MQGPWLGAAALITAFGAGASPQTRDDGATRRDRSPSQASLSSRNYLRGDKIDPQDFGYNTLNLGGGAVDARMAGRGRSYGGGARAALGDYQRYPEGRPIFLPEAERYGNPPDLPSLLLQQRVIYISMPVRASMPQRQPSGQADQQAAVTQQVVERAWRTAQRGRRGRALRLRPGGRRLQKGTSAESEEDARSLTLRTGRWRHRSAQWPQSHSRRLCPALTRPPLRPAVPPVGDRAGGGAVLLPGL